MWYFNGGDRVMAATTGKSKTVGFERKCYTVKGGKVLTFGDLHLSSTYEGSHKDYMLDCYTTMELIVKHVKENKPSAIFLLGDIIGVNEKNIRDRQFLMRVIMFFTTLYNVTKGNVYAVKGNHDMGDFSDFDMLVGLGYIKNPKYVDYEGDNGLEIRFHFVNYGDEKKKLDIVKEEASNIVLGHADYYIDGVTTWYPSKGYTELKKLKNFCGVDLVFAGHIHIPSKEMLFTTLSDGESVGLFYLGSPSRTAERYDDCWYVTFEYIQEQGSSTYDARFMGLPKADEVFYPKEDFELDEEAEVQEKKNKALEEIVEEVLNSRILTGDVFKQIDAIPADEEVKELAKKYLRVAMN